MGKGGSAAKRRPAGVKVTAVKTAAIITVSAVIMILACACLCGSLKKKDRDAGSLSGASVLATLAGEPVTYGEFCLFFPRVRALVVSELNDKYGLTDSSGYWTAPLPDKTTPLELAVDRTMQVLREIKARQLVFYENGLWEDISYEAFQKSWMEENNRRAETVQNGEVIYGPRTYDEAWYFSYLMDQCGNKLEQKLSAHNSGESITCAEQIEALVAQKLDMADFQVNEQIVKIIMSRENMSIEN